MKLELYMTSRKKTYSIGIDIEKTNTFKLSAVKNNFIQFAFTKKEIGLCQKMKESHIAFAGKFCAKEAVVKAFGGNLDIRSVEVLNSPAGQPEVYIDGKKRDDIKCSISHTEDMAIAMVIVC